MDFADDVCLVTHVFYSSWFHPVLEVFAAEAASLGLEVNWQRLWAEIISHSLPLRFMEWV